MHAISDRLRLLYVTTAGTNPERVPGADDPTVEVSVATATEVLDAAFDHDEVDCLLVTAAAVDAHWAELREVLSAAGGALPAVIFHPTGRTSVVEDALDIEATEIVRSTVEETTESLARQRVETAVEKGDGPARTVKQYERILNTAADAIYQLDTEGRIVAVNDAAVALTGHSRDDLLGEHVSQFLDESDIRAGQELIRRQLAGDIDRVGTIETAIERTTGEVIPCETRITVLQSEDKFVGSVGVVRDVSEKRERERELAQARELLRDAERLADFGAWEFDPNGERQHWTDGTRRIHEVSDDYEPTVDRGVEFYHPDDREEIRRLFDRAVEAGEPYEAELRIITAEDNRRWVRTHGEPVLEDGEVQKVRGFIQDITELKEREQALQEERDLIEHIYETSPTGICVLDGDGIIQRINERAAEICGVDRDALLDRTYDEIPFTVTDAEGDQIPPAEFPASQAIQTGESRYNDEVRIHRPDSDAVWVSFNCVPTVEDGEVRRVVATLDDITERREREEKIATQRDELATLNRINSIIRDVDKALLEAASREEILDAVCSELTASGRYRFALALETVGDRLEADTWTADATAYVDGVFPMTSATGEVSPAVRATETGNVEVVRDVVDDDEFQTAGWRDAATDADVRSLAALPLDYDDRQYGVITVYATEPDAFTERELSVLDELGGTVASAIAAVESREREAILTSLYEATQDLLTAESRQEVCDVVVSTAADVLSLSGVGLFLFDDEDNVLRPAAATEDLLEFYGGPVVFGPGANDSETWQAYATGEPRQFDDIRNSDRLAAPDTDARGTLFLPLGDHGVFSFASTTKGAFDDEKRRLIGLLAATTEAALDRVAGRIDIAERDQELARRARRLERTERVLDCIRDVDDLLQRAGTREEIEESVCERLTRMEPYTFAWIGTQVPDENRLVPQHWAGVERGYLDDIDRSLASQEPALRTAATGESTHVANVTDHLQDQSWARAAVDRNVQSVVAVPLVYGETTYGVLTVYADAPDAFEEPIAEVLPELGERIAHAINAVETKRGVLAEQYTELELALEDADQFLNAVASVAGEPVSYREITPTGDETARVLFALTDPPVEEILALDSEFVSVQSLTHTERGTEHIFRATLSGRTVTATLLDCGAIPQEVVKTATETRATMRLPQQLDVRVFLDRVHETYPSAELVRREDSESSGGEEDVRVALEKHLTDRQREVLLTAFESGFFESPRETTGAELAAMLDISQPTVTHHLREAQKRLFTALFDGIEDDEQ